MLYDTHSSLLRTCNPYKMQCKIIPAAQKFKANLRKQMTAQYKDPKRKRERRDNKSGKQDRGQTQGAEFEARRRREKRPRVSESWMFKCHSNGSVPMIDTARHARAALLQRQHDDESVQGGMHGRPWPVCSRSSVQRSRNSGVVHDSFGDASSTYDDPGGIEAVRDSTCGLPEC